MTTSTPLRLLVAALMVTAVVLGVGVLVRTGPAASRPALARPDTSSAIVAPVGEVRAAALLRGWDAARADAWAAGDVGRLGALYTRGSTAGERDRDMLRQWLRRGLVVRDLRTQVLAVRELRRTAGTWVLRVTDRLSAGIAVGHGRVRPLPADAATTRTVTLRRVGARWLVESVSPAPS
jgi:hypothetical protein